MPEKMLTVAGDTRVACVIFGVQSDSDVVGVVGVFCCKLYATSYFKSNANKINLNNFGFVNLCKLILEIFEFFCNRSDLLIGITRFDIDRRQ